MPYKQIRVTPARYLTHNGVCVYHTYKDDEVEQGASRFTFTLDRDHDGEELERFDVRELKTPNVHWLKGHPPYQTESDAQWAAADEATREKWRKEWDDWHSGGESRAIKAVLREALDMGLLKVPELAEA